MSRFARAITVMALSAPLAGCLGSADMCGNQVISRVDAPDGTLSAALFQRDCGAATGFSTQISILPRGETPTESGNIFVADDDHGAALAAEWGGPWASVQWLGPGRLLVRYAPRSRVFVRKEVMAGVRITYQQANE